MPFRVFHNLFGRFFCGKKQMHILNQIGNAERRKTVLSASEKITGPPQFQVFFTDQKSVVGLAKGLKPFQRCFVSGIGNQKTIRFFAASSNAAPQLVQLG